MKRIPDEIASFSKTIKDSDLSSIAKNGMEIGIDSVINNELLKEIPIVNTLVSLIKTAYSINTYLFLKKIISFLNGISSISTERRNTMISKIDKSSKYKTKVGEKLLFILDKSDDTEKASLIAKAFFSFLKNTIDYSDFIKIAHIINNIFIEDFYHFIKINPKRLTEEDAQLYISFGLCLIVFSNPEINHFVPDTWDEGPERDYIEKGENDYIITDIGKKIMKIFQ